MKIMNLRLVSMALLLTSALYNCSPSIEKQETPPKDPSQFFTWLKQASEAKWRKNKLNDEIYGFQIQQEPLGTRGCLIPRSPGSSETWAFRSRPSTSFT